MAAQRFVPQDSGRFDVIPYEDLSPEHTWKTLGRGSFGRVFKGLYLGLEVAIKEVLNSDEYDVDKYFRRECTLMKECRHPNIVQFIGLSLAPSPPPDYLPPMTFSDNGTVVTNSNPRPPAPPRRRILIISEFLPNGNLRSHIYNQSLDFSWRLRLSFSVDIARALAYLHARNCMHRDLKGENLLITENDRVKVCDFGFARIAARNEDEMKRMSYCGTDGYMSPEILVGEEFSLPTDIFSLGVIFCEIISRQLVDDDTFKRTMPTFGLNADEIRDRVSPGCPPAFTELTIACVAVDPSQRPNIRTVLEQLMLIEHEIIDAEAANAYNVGSLTFGARHAGRKTKASTLKRPQPGRIPSFQGTVSVPRTTGDEEPSSSDEDVDETLAKLEKLQIGAKGSIYLNPHANEGTFKLNDSQEERSSTYSVVKGSKIGKRSSFFTPDGSTSSMMTVKPDAPESSWSRNTVPSLPASWLSQAKAEEAVEPEPANPQAEVSREEGIVSSPVDEDGSFQAGKGEEDSPVIIMPGSLPEMKFATIKSLSLPIPASLEAMKSPTISTQGGPSPHRFTLVKPGWRALWETPEKQSRKASASSASSSKRSSLDGHGASPIRRSSDNERSGFVSPGGIAAILPLQLLGAGLLTRCAMCEKRLGLMKPYLACDDCQQVFHVRCGDLVSMDCGGFHTPNASQLELGRIRKDSKADKGKRESRKLVKSTPRSSLLMA